jgi:hypothetical protein
MAGFEPGIFCSVGGRDDHYATPPGQKNILKSIVKGHVDDPACGWNMCN